MSATCANGLDTPKEGLYPMLMSLRILSAALLLVFLGLSGCAGKQSTSPGQDSAKAHALVAEAHHTLQTLLDGDKGDVLRKLLPRAKGVMIVPDMGSAGFLFSLDTGNGVLLALNNGQWAGPVFLTEASGGFGMQAGITRMSGVFIYTDEADIRYVLDSGGVFQGRASVTVLNTTWQGRDTPKFQESGNVFFVGESQGLYAGAGVHGGGLMSREYLNKAYYDFGDGDPEAILFKGFPAPDDGRALRGLLAETIARAVQDKKRTEPKFRPNRLWGE